MKILIAGDGKVGSTLTRQLSADGYDVTLIDSDSKVLKNSAELYDVMTISGNCASMKILSKAGVMGADLLIAVTNADEMNLLCCMTAHSMNPKLHTIARIRNPEYSEQVYKMRNTLALSLAVNPEKQAAREIARLLKYPGFLKRETFAKGRAEIVELRIDKESKICNVALNNLDSIIKCKILVCAVLRNDEAIMPDGNFIIKEGDRIFVTASSDVLTTLLKNLDIITHKVKKVLLAGGGKVSFYLATLLEKSGVSVKIIDNDYDRCLELANELKKSSVVHGDASSQAILKREGINNCDALVTLTGLDELNMVISLYGTSCSVPQIITKLGHVEYNNIINTLPVGSTVCPKSLCCDTIVRYVRAIQNQTGSALSVHSIADGHTEAMEFYIGDGTENCGVPLKEIKTKSDVLIVCISHNGNTIIPDGESKYEKGDTIIVVTNANSDIRVLNDIFD